MREIGEGGIREAIILALLAANVTNARDLDYKIEPGSIRITVFGPEETLEEIAQAVRNDNVQVELQDQTFTAHSVDQNPGDESTTDDDEEHDLSDGELAGVIIGAFALVVLAALAAVMIDRSRRGRRQEHSLESVNVGDQPFGQPAGAEQDTAGPSGRAGAGGPYAQTGHQGSSSHV